MVLSHIGRTKQPYRYLPTRPPVDGSLRSKTATSYDVPFMLPLFVLFSKDIRTLTLG
jgi:hypothetical protein